MIHFASSRLKQEVIIDLEPLPRRLCLKTSHYNQNSPDLHAKYKYYDIPVRFDIVEIFMDREGNTRDINLLKMFLEGGRHVDS